MKLPFHFFAPLLLSSCSSLISGNKTSPVDIPPPPSHLAAEKKTTGSPTSPASTATTSPSASSSTEATKPKPSNGTLDFLDPDTTQELMTESNRKTVTISNTQLAPPPEIKGDGAIDIKPPEVPGISENR